MGSEVLVSEFVVGMSEKVKYVEAIMVRKIKYFMLYSLQTL
jgi:hypothetical protein